MGGVVWPVGVQPGLGAGGGGGYGWRSAPGSVLACSDLNDAGYRRNTISIQNEKHVVAWRSYVGVRGRDHIEAA